MALCTSCGSEVDDAASFCTSCGQRMPAGLQPAAAVTAPRSVCSACGAQADPGFAFCTNCGQRIAAEALAEPAPGPAVDEPIATADAAPVSVDAPPTPGPPLPVDEQPMPANPSASSSTAACSSCGTALPLDSRFCTSCGQPASAGDTITAVPVASAVLPSQRAIDFASPEPAKVPIAAKTAIASAVPSVPVPEDAATQPAAPQIAPPIYATPSDYQPTQPRGGAFRMLVLILLLVIVVGVFGGWYFWGVETVIVCSPPDVRVFLDDKELAPSSYGRYVVPHLSRQSHLLKVQRPGFADTLQRLDFSLTSLHEWVNIKLVPSRQMR
jgi:Double zinc ribbon